jgi:hypothetical protein
LFTVSKSIAESTCMPATSRSEPAWPRMKAYTLRPVAALGPLEVAIELTVEESHLEQLDVGELEDGQHVLHVGPEEQRGVPVDHRRVAGV